MPDVDLELTLHVSRDQTQDTHEHSKFSNIFSFINTIEWRVVSFLYSRG